MPADHLGTTILKIVDDLELHNHHSIIVFVDVSNLPNWVYFFQNTLDIEYNNAIFNISANTKRNLLIFSRNDLTNSVTDKLILRVRQIYQNESAENISFILTDIVNNTLRPLIEVSGNNFTDYSVERFHLNLDEWIVKHKHLEECEDCRTEIEKFLSVLIILGCSCLFVSLILGAAAIARNQLLKKRVSKGPYKVLLTAADFVFPQIADSRRVSITVGIHFD